MNFRFHPEALAEFHEAALSCATIRPALGLDFTARVETAIRNIVDAPRMYAILEQDVRRCVITRVFPYAVLYTIENDFILIVAIMHSHRKPGYWRHRMGSHN